MAKPDKAEKDRPMRVKLINSPSGSGCRHVHVTDLSGALLDVFSRDEFGEDEQDGEPRVRRRIKYLVKRWLRDNPGATPAQIKAFIEGEEV